MNHVEVGKSYQVTHQRKGTFVGIVSATDPDDVTILITSGKAEAMLDCNVREPAIVRRELASFTPL